MKKENYLRRTNLKGGKLVIGQEIKTDTYGVSGMCPNFFKCDSLKLSLYIRRLMKSYGLKYVDFGKLMKLAGLKPPFEVRKYFETYLVGGKKVRFFQLRQSDNTEFYVTFDENVFANGPKETDFMLIKDVPYESLEGTIFNKIYNYYHIEIKEKSGEKSTLYTVSMTESCIISSPEEGFERISLTYTYTDTSINFVKKIKRSKESSKAKYRFKVEVASKVDAHKIYTNIDVLEAYFACIHEDLAHEKEVDRLLNIMEFTNKDIPKTVRVLYSETIRDTHTLEKKERYTFDYECDGDSVVFKVYSPGLPINMAANSRSTRYFEEDEEFLLKAAAHSMTTSDYEFDLRLLEWCILNKKQYHDIVSMLDDLGFEGHILVTYTGKDMIYKVETYDDTELVSFDDDGKIRCI